MEVHDQLLRVINTKMFLLTTASVVILGGVGALCAVYGAGNEKQREQAVFVRDTLFGEQGVFTGAVQATSNLLLAVGVISAIRKYKLFDELPGQIQNQIMNPMYKI
jgi:hypothetical protein